jgi:hypothetical protein
MGTAISRSLAESLVIRRGIDGQQRRGLPIGSGGGMAVFPYPLSGKDVAAREYSKDLWLNNGGGRCRIALAGRKIQPARMGYVRSVDQLKEHRIYKHIHIAQRPTRYRGLRIIKMPTDMLLYHKVIWETKPDIIVESERNWRVDIFQDQLDMLGLGGKVV